MDAHHDTAEGRIRVWFGLRQIMNSTDDLLLRTKEAADRRHTGINMVRTSPTTHYQASIPSLHSPLSPVSCLPSFMFLYSVYSSVPQSLSSSRHLSSLLHTHQSLGVLSLCSFVPSIIYRLSSIVYRLSSIVYRLSWAMGVTARGGDPVREQARGCHAGVSPGHGHPPGQPGAARPQPAGRPLRVDQRGGGAAVRSSRCERVSLPRERHAHAGVQSRGGDVRGGGERLSGNRWSSI